MISSGLKRSDKKLSDHATKRRVIATTQSNPAPKIAIVPGSSTPVLPSFSPMVLNLAATASVALEIFDGLGITLEGCRRAPNEKYDAAGLAESGVVFLIPFVSDVDDAPAIGSAVTIIAAASRSDDCLSLLTLNFSGSYARAIPSGTLANVIWWACKVHASFHDVAAAGSAIQRDFNDLRH
jgi:hypothetical protein